MSSPVDLVSIQDEYKKHLWNVCLWPAQWKIIDTSLNLSWENVELDSQHKSKIPSTTGIYSLVIQPEIIGNHVCSCLMYLGKTKDLRNRFGQYLTTEKTKRPKIIRLLHMYNGYIQFFYSRVNESMLDNTEEQLINALIPPCNTTFTGIVQKAVRAF